MAPVRNSPAGTTTRPPPALPQASMALRKASVQSVLPSAFAPKPITEKSRAGNVGALMRAKMRGANISQGPSACAFSSDDKDAALSIRVDVNSPSKSAPALLPKNVCRNSRRFDINDYLLIHPVFADLIF